MESSTPTQVLSASQDASSPHTPANLNTFEPTATPSTPVRPKRLFLPRPISLNTLRFGAIGNPEPLIWNRPIVRDPLRFAPINDNEFYPGLIHGRVGQDASPLRELSDSEDETPYSPARSRRRLESPSLNGPDEIMIIVIDDDDDEDHRPAGEPNALPGSPDLLPAPITREATPPILTQAIPSPPAAPAAPTAAVVSDEIEPFESVHRNLDGILSASNRIESLLRDREIKRAMNALIHLKNEAHQARVTLYKLQGLP